MQVQRLPRYRALREPLPPQHRPISLSLVPEAATTARPLPLAGSAPDLLSLVLESPDLSELGEALKRCGLDVVLRCTGPFTLLAPCNGGFDLAAARLGLRRRELLADPHRLADLLSHQVLAGAWHSSELPWGQRLHSLLGEPLALGALGLLGPEAQPQRLLPESDRPARNGVLHRIATPLIPLRWLSA